MNKTAASSTSQRNWLTSIPKDLLGNLAFRQKLVTKAAGSKNLQRELWNECKADLLFYLNAFVWTYDPRTPRKVLPFITYAFQDEGLGEICDAILGVDPVTGTPGHDLAIEKSRDMGATWMVLAAIEWRARFHNDETYLLASRNEEMVDKNHDPDELFWKLDFIDRYLPSFLRDPKRVRIRKHIDFPSTHSTIDGESTNEGLAVGGRKTAILLDENARMRNGHTINDATADVTNCRLKVSTPHGPATSFSQDIAKGRCRVWTAHWSRHPDKARGLYTVDSDGLVTILDRDYWADADRRHSYKFAETPPNNPRFKFRSLWYDEQCRKRSQVDIAENLDIDHQRSQSLFFDPAEIARLNSTCRNPLLTGELDYDRENGRPLGFRATNQRTVVSGRLWTELQLGIPPRDRFYYVGVDTSAGTGASNSSISVWDGKLRQKVAEFSSPKLRPEAFAILAVAVCNWFCDPKGDPAQMAFEQNGPGRTFGQRAVELGFRNFYRRRPEQTLASELAKIPGWFPTPGNKEALLAGYRRALSSGEALNPDELSLNECLDYVYLQSGAIEHVSQTEEIDPSGAKSNHGDRVVADALAVMLLGIKPPDEKKVVTGNMQEPQPFSYLWRLKRLEAEQNREQVY